MPADGKREWASTFGVSPPRQNWRLEWCQVSVFSLPCRDNHAGEQSPLPTDLNEGKS